MVNLSTYTFTLPTKRRKTQYTLPFTLSLYQPNTVKHNILFHLHFTLSTKHRRTQYIFSATVYFFHSHFTTYDLRCFATKQTSPIYNSVFWSCFRVLTYWGIRCGYTSVYELSRGNVGRGQPLILRDARPECLAIKNKTRENCGVQAIL